MKIDLPVEVWVDSFESVPRIQLAALLPHIGDEQKKTKNRPIADRQFVRNVQFYLHKCGDAILGRFSIESSTEGPIFVNYVGQELLLAEVPPMPSNIKSFKGITINYYDRSVLDFLQEFRRNSLLTNVHLILCGGNRRKFDAMSLMMTQLLPSITSIESLRSYDYEHNAVLFQEELSDMLSHFGFGYDDVYVYRHWLHIPRDDGKPRILQATKLTLINGIYPILPLIEKIKKDFLDANQAVSFFACIFDLDMDLTHSRYAANVQSISLTNDKTQEKLVIKGIGPHPEHFVMKIARYPMGATEEWPKEVWKIVDDLGWTYSQERLIEVNLNI